MRVGLGESFAGAHRNRPQEHDRRDPLANPGAVFGLDLARDDVQDVGPHRVNHRANLVAIVGQRQRHTARARANRGQNFARQVSVDRFGDDAGLGNDEANQLRAGVGGRDRVDAPTSCCRFELAIVAIIRGRRAAACRASRRCIDRRPRSSRR